MAKQTRIIHGPFFFLIAFLTFLFLTIANCQAASESNKGVQTTHVLTGVWITHSSLGDEDPGLKIFRKYDVPLDGLKALDNVMLLVCDSDGIKLSCEPKARPEFLSNRSAHLRLTLVANENDHKRWWKIMASNDGISIVVRIDAKILIAILEANAFSLIFDDDGTKIDFVVNTVGILDHALLSAFPPTADIKTFSDHDVSSACMIQ